MRTSEVLALREKVFHQVRQYIWDHNPKCITARMNSKQIFNKRPTGLNGHLSIRDFTLTSCQKGSYLYINSPIIE